MMNGHVLKRLRNFESLGQDEGSHWDEDHTPLAKQKRRRNILANRSKRRVNDFLMMTHDSYEMHSPMKDGSPMNKTLLGNSSKQEKGKTKPADDLIPLFLYGHLHSRKMVDRFREYNERQDENLRSRITDYSDT